ncbi:hypothetical protein HPB50_009286 [Hyalomma asiaticum]|uniref:Uncharacterized protein n=1 Tax=Hyalomma asiaticum TaxID=266040 RepID=A0ACB7TDJ3_HYAAI|nr:hypothetical protein HPB50_009286 [Hyalomma asiaticum]
MHAVTVIPRKELFRPVTKPRPVRALSPFSARKASVTYTRPVQLTVKRRRVCSLRANTARERLCTHQARPPDDAPGRARTRTRGHQLRKVVSRIRTLAESEPTSRGGDPAQCRGCRPIVSAVRAFRMIISPSFTYRARLRTGFATSTPTAPVITARGAGYDEEIREKGAKHGCLRAINKCESEDTAAAESYRALVISTRVL